MSEQVIKFICGEPKVAEHYPVVPASKLKPQWYKDTRAWVGEAHQSYPTIKKCMPVGDLINGGYIVPNPVEQHLRSEMRRDVEAVQGFVRQYPVGWSIQAPQEGHEHEQCPVRDKGVKKDYITFIKPKLTSI